MESNVSRSHHPVFDVRVGPLWWRSASPAELGDAVFRLVDAFHPVRIELYPHEIILAIDARSIKHESHDVEISYRACYDQTSVILEEVHARHEYEASMRRVHLLEFIDD